MERPKRVRKSVEALAYTSLGGGAVKKPRPQKKAAAKTPAKKPTGAKAPQNWDDDEQVEAFNERVDALQEVAEAQKEAQRNQGKAGTSLEQAMIKSVAQVVTNIENDCPVAHPFEAFVFIQSPDDLGKHSSTRIMVTRKGFGGSADHKLLEKLAGGDEDMGCCEPSSDMDALRTGGRFKSVAAAMPELVSRGVKAGIVAQKDEKRLAELFSLWMKGTKWNKCFMHGGNRPSLGSWNGYPWEWMNIEGKNALSRGLTGTSVEPVLERCSHPSDVAPQDLVPCFVKVWSKESGRVADIDQACHLAISNMRALTDKSKSKQKGKKK